MTVDSEFKNLIPPLSPEERQGRISVNAAYQVTKLEQEEQEEIAHRIEHIGIDSLLLGRLTLKGE